jgi:protein-tyrosine kinase
MSRVDDALRRAAGEPVNAAQADDSIPVSAVGAAALDATEEGGTLVLAPNATVAPPSSTTTAEVPQHSYSLLERIDQRLAEKVVVDAHISAASREQYRQLAAVLHDAQAVNGLKVVMVASALAGEGKTLTATNLAMTLSESYRKRVLLIDADLRRPNLHQLFKVVAATGLSEGLVASGETKLIVRQITPGLALLPAGRPTQDPMGALTSERMHRLIAEARDAFDWVIIDTPPLVLLPDAHLLAPMADGVLMVVRAKSTPHAMAKRAVDAIGSVRLLGVVLNAARATDYPKYYRYDDYYGSERTESAGVVATR